MNGEKSMRQNKKTKILILSVGAVAVALLVLVLFLGKGRNTFDFFRYQTPPWNELTVTEQYDRLELNGKVYGGDKETVALPLSACGEKIADTVLLGYDKNDPNYVQNMEQVVPHKIEAEIYRIADIHTDYAVAVKFAGQEDYYVYDRLSYEPETVGTMIEDLNLKNTLQFIKVKHGEQEISISENESRLIWDFLQNNRSAKCDPTKQITGELGIQLKWDLKAEDHTIEPYFAVSADGYLISNLTDALLVFEIGKEAAENFISQWQ